MVLNSASNWFQNGSQTLQGLALDPTGQTPQGTRTCPVDDTMGFMALYSFFCLYSPRLLDPAVVSFTIVLSNLPSNVNVSKIVSMSLMDNWT